MIESVSTPGCAARAEHFGDDSLAVVQRRGETEHLDDHFVVGLGVLRAGIAHADRPGEHRAVDLHVGRAGRLEIRADELMRLPLDHFDDAAARAKLAATLTADLDQHHVAGGGVGRLFGGNVDVFRLFGSPPRLIEPDEAEALLRSLEDAEHAIAAPFGVRRFIAAFFLRGGVAMASSSVLPKAAMNRRTPKLRVPCLRLFVGMFAGITRWFEA